MENSRFLVVAVSLACSIITIISIITFFIILCKNKNVRHFQSSLYCCLFISDIMTIFSSLLREGASSSSTLCTVAQFILELFTISFYTFTSALVIFILTLVKRSIFFNKFLSELKYQLLFHFTFWGFSLILSIIATASYPPLINSEGRCTVEEKFKWFHWSVWILTATFNFSCLGYIYLVLRRIDSFSQKYPLRIVLSIAVIVGMFRIPSFMIAMITNDSVVNILGSGNYALGIFGLFASGTTAIQSTFVVIVILVNHRVISCCTCLRPATTETNDVSKSENSHNMRSKSTYNDASLSIVAVEES